MAEFDFVEHLPSVMPVIGLTILAIIVLALDLYLPESQRKYTGYVAAIGMLLLAIVPIVFAPDPDESSYWGGMIRHDILSQFFTVMVLLAGAITSLIAVDSRNLARKGEFYLIIIVSTLGASLMAAASDLIMVFVALETTSIPLYILAGLNRNDEKSVESSLKYFLFGAFASTIMLYGFSLLYGFTGETGIEAIGQYLGSGSIIEPIPVLLSMVFIFVGFGFKISAVPFHFWAPDVYEGAPTPVTAFISVASKAASFALLIRFLVAVFPETAIIDGNSMQEFWLALVSALAVVSMIVGNTMALVQKNVKRLLAYSSIAQAGYALIGVAAIQSQSDQGVAAVAFYMFMYTFTNLLAFGVVVVFSETTGRDDIADFAGLNRRSPMMALAMTVAFLSLGGIPPAAGFFGKFFVFNAAVEAHLEWLAIIGVLNSIVALYYYLVFIKVMYVDHSADENEPMPIPKAAAWTMGFTTLAVILLGVVPSAVFEWAQDGASALLGIIVG
jgi:NADH-quinone oxidoreductase subunit N